MDGDAVTLLPDDEAKISPKPKRRAAAKRPSPASNVMYMPAARKRPAKQPQPVEPVPVAAPVAVAPPPDWDDIFKVSQPVKASASSKMPELIDFDDIFEPVPPVKLAALPLAHVRIDADFEDVPPPTKAPPPVIDATPETKPARKRDAAGRFIPANDDGTPRRSRNRTPPQAVPVNEQHTATMLPPPVVNTPTPLQRFIAFCRRTNWADVGVNCVCGFLCCSIAAAFCFFAFIATNFAHSMIFGEYYYGNEPFWHWPVSFIAGILGMPFFIMGALLHGDAQITNALSNPSSPVGSILRGGAAPDQQYQSTQNGSSQFAMYPGVQRSGIWQP